MRTTRPIVRRDDVLSSAASPRLVRAIALVTGIAFVAAVALMVDCFAPSEAWSTRFSNVVTTLQLTNATVATAMAAALLFTAAACVGCPINLCIAVCMIVLSPVRGFVVAFAGTLSSAAILHAAGRMVPPRRSARWFRKRKALQRQLRRSIVAVAFVRLVPVAPYAVVCLFAGALRVPRLRYLAGTALGMLPGIAVYAIFIDRAEAVLRGAHAPAALAAAAATVLVVAIWITCERVAGRR